MKNKNFKNIIIALIIFVMTLFTGFYAAADNVNKGLDIQFFYSETCPHCAKQKPLMYDLDQQNKDIQVHFWEVRENPEKWAEYRHRYNIPGAVPRTFIGDTSFIGYSEEDGELEYNPVYVGYIGYRNQIIQAIENHLGKKIKLSSPKVKQEKKNGTG